MRKQLGLVLLSFACGLASPAWAGFPGSGGQGWLHPIDLLGKSKKEAFRKPSYEDVLLTIRLWIIGKVAQRQKED